MSCNGQDGLTYSGAEVVREESKSKAGEMYREGWMTDQSLVCCANSDCIAGACADLSGIGMWVWQVSVVKQAGGAMVVE